VIAHPLIRPAPEHDRGSVAAPLCASPNPALVVSPIAGSGHCEARAGDTRHTALMARRTKILLLALLAVDAVGGAVAVKHRVAGEPFGIGGSLDVRNPAVVALWGTALSAPITSLGLAVALSRHRPEVLRVMGAMFAVGALSEPAFWGRRPCPRHGRMLLVAHVIVATALAVGPARTVRADEPHQLTAAP
jgi:hypothetical protein